MKKTLNDIWISGQREGKTWWLPLKNVERIILDDKTFSILFESFGHNDLPIVSVSNNKASYVQLVKELKRILQVIGE